MIEFGYQVGEPATKTLKGIHTRMSSMIDLASHIVSDDPAKVFPLFSLIAKVSDHPKDPLKAAYRTEVLKWLFAQSPKFQQTFDAELAEAEVLDEDQGRDQVMQGAESASGASH